MVAGETELITPTQRSLLARIPLAGWTLVAAAVVLETVYAGFLLRRFPLLDYYATPLLDLGKIGGYDLAAGLATGLALTALVAAHALAWRGARRLGAAAVAPIMAASLLFQATLALVYPIVAADVFNYAVQGRLLAVHGLNPLTARPADAGNDPWLPFSAYRTIQLAYGPVWAWLSALVVAVARDDLLVALLGFKALAIIANLVNCWLIYRTAALLHPAGAVPALLFYAWNPLVLFETVANAHNDGVMATPLLLALWLVVRGGGRALLAPAALTAAVLIKYTPAILLPLVALGSWQRRRRPLPVLLGLALAGLVLAAGFLPFWQGPVTLAGLQRQAEETTTSAAALLVVHRVGGLTRETWLPVLRPLTTALLLAVMWWRRPSGPTGLPAAVFDTLLAQLLIATFWFQPWYLVPLLAVAAAGADRRRAVLALVFAASAWASYLVYFYLWTTPWWGTLTTVSVQTLAAAVVYLPPALLLAWWAVRNVKRET